MIITQKGHTQKTTFLLLFIAAFIIRAAVFFFYIEHDTRYQQPDSMDYHNCALSIWWGTGMHRADTKTPIFWRTPGYPAFLAPFYHLFPSTKTGFADWHYAHTAAIIVQIIFNALLPLLIWLLAMLLTQHMSIALIAAWITVLHPGFILASTYLLTEGIATILFVLFLYFWYAALRTVSLPYQYSVLAALCLSIYTWMRPMGQFVAVVCSLLWLLLGQDQLKQRLKKICLFVLCFGALLAPWYMRNYHLTGQWFFCPMSGPYLNSFCGPKILRSVKGTSLEQGIRILYGIAEQRAQEAEKALTGTGYVLARETVCSSVSWPLIKAYPWLFIKDWTREVVKTTFDLYSYQLTALANNTFRYDPLEEFLSEKLHATLWSQPMPWWMRMVAYTELIYMLLLWIGLVGGLITFMVVPMVQRLRRHAVHTNMYAQEIVWWQVLPLIVAIVSMTGGFGYARLRLPVEPLMIILSLMWWKVTLTGLKDGASE